jgi:hypothetical protein
MSRRTRMWTAVLTTVFLAVFSAQGGPITIANYSFEIPALDPNDFPAVPVAPFWIELDLDPLYSSNTGVFRNQPPGSPAGDHIVNADGNQLAFLSSQTGNAFLQDLPAVFQPGYSYRMRVDVCPSTRYPPHTTEPMDLLTLGFYAGTDPNDFITSTVPATEMVNNLLKTFSLVLPVVQPGDPWAGEPIGISIRAAGAPGAYWDVDNVRLTEFSPVPEFTNDSFVNLEDLAAMAAEWLSCTAVLTDVTGDNCADVEDLVILSEYWLQNV